MSAATSSQADSEPKGNGIRRISEADALSLYEGYALPELGRMAHEACMTLHPEDCRTYVVDRNINYSNLCTAHCSFCNFKARPGSEDGYVLTREELVGKIDELVAVGGTQILLQGGLVPADVLDFGWYRDLLEFIKQRYPAIHLHAFSPPEIHAFAENFGMSVRDVLLRLRDAGLDTIPGGGAEILVDRVRDRISVGKSRTDDYLAVMRQAHLIGMRTSITMMFGHIETIAERIEHLRRVRELQDETGGFTAYIGWTFQPAGTALGRTPQLPIEPGSRPDGKHLALAGAHEYLKMLCVSRLYLDNVQNLQASWVTQGSQIGQLALFFGANDMGSVMMEENVVSAAGTMYRLSEEEIRSLISDAGWRPSRRNCYYELLG